MKAFFWFLAGAEVFLLKNCPQSQNKYLRGGIIIFIIGVLSGFSAGYAIYGSFNGNMYAAIALGLGWALVVIMLDSLIVSSIKDTGTTKEKMYRALPRVVLSIFIGIVIARPAEIRLFEKEIRDKLIDIEMANCVIRTAKQTVEQREALARYKREKEAADKASKNIAKDIECLNLLLDLESNGRTINYKLPCGDPSGFAGKGDDYRRHEEKISDYKAQQQEQQQKLKQFGQLIENTEQKLLNYEGECKQRADVMQTEPLSLLQANTALNTLISHGTSDGNTGVGTIILFVTLLIVLIELLPVTVKLFQGPGAYEEVLEAFNHDHKTMPYLDLLQKYPFLPSRKGYLENLKRNKHMHEKLLQQYMALSELNSNAQLQLDILQDRNQVQKANESEVNQKIADEMKESQLRVAERLIEVWESETIQDINSHPERYVTLPKDEAKAPG